MSEEDLLLTIEGCLDSCIRENYPNDWYEDQISRDICKGLRKRLGSISDVAGHSPWTERKINWAVFKQSGHKETKWGDIAVLVDIAFKGGTHLEGVGFLEAKKRNLKKASFDEIRERQLKTISHHAPLAQMLFYDYEPSTIGVRQTISPHWETPYSRVEDVFTMHSSRVVCAPISTVLAGSIRTRDQLYVSVPLSYQLVYRYLRGFDLHHRKEILEIIKGHVADTSLPAFLLKVSIRYDGAIPDGPSINRAIWQPIDDQLG